MPADALTDPSFAPTMAAETKEADRQQLSKVGSDGSTALDGIADIASGVADAAASGVGDVASGLFEAIGGIFN